MNITKSYFGTANTGEMIQLYHMENTSGAYVELADYGGRLIKISVPSRNQIMTDVCFGLETPEPYAAAAISSDAAGICGFKIWNAKIKQEKLIFSTHLTEGPDHCPANISLTVTYGWSEDNELSILYEALTDRETLFHVTSHGYFNLNGIGNGDTLSHELFIDADSAADWDNYFAPGQTQQPVEGTPFDFRDMHAIGKFIHTDHTMQKNSGIYNHNYMINGTGLREAAILQSQISGIRMTCFTDQPGLRLYADMQNIELFPYTFFNAQEYFHAKTLYHFSTF